MHFLLAIFALCGPPGSNGHRNDIGCREAVQRIPDVQLRAQALLFLWHGGKHESPQPVPWSLDNPTTLNQPEVVKMLLDLGVNPNGPTAKTISPLSEAALRGNLETVRALIAAGARIDVYSQSGTLPIHDAALSDNPELIRELIKHGSDPNARSRPQFQTPLHVAAALGKLKSIQTLLELGASRDLKDFENRTPVDLAERAALTQAIALLRK